MPELDWRGNPGANNLAGTLLYPARESALAAEAACVAAGPFSSTALEAQLSLAHQGFADCPARFSRQWVRGRTLFLAGREAPPLVCIASRPAAPKPVWDVGSMSFTKRVVSICAW